MAEARGRRRPFFLYLSHKAVHSDFIPADRHKGRYAGQTVHRRQDMADSAGERRGKPMWVQNQRNSWHGVDYPYHGTLDIADYYRRYARRCWRWTRASAGSWRARERGLLDSTLVIYMGDNGFAFGEHGLIDKRTAYEESMRVPMLIAGLSCPAGTTVEEVVANIDIAPTILEARRPAAAGPMDGRSFLPLARGERVPGATRSCTSTTGSATSRRRPRSTPFAAAYKYIRYHGIWDIDELYDLRADPLETAT